MQVLTTDLRPGDLVFTTGLGFCDRVVDIAQTGASDGINQAVVVARVTILRTAHGRVVPSVWYSGLRGVHEVIR